MKSSIFSRLLLAFSVFLLAIYFEGTSQAVTKKKISSSARAKAIKIKSRKHIKINKRLKNAILSSSSESVPGEWPPLRTPRCLAAGLISHDIDRNCRQDFNDVRTLALVAAGKIACPADLETCDVSGNGRITSYDAALLKRYVLNRYDLDKDSNLSKSDATLLGEIIVGLKKCTVATCDFDYSGSVNSYDGVVFLHVVSTRFLDVNADGKEDFDDAKELGRIAAGIVPCQVDFSICDNSGDGEISSFDASLLTSNLITRHDLNSDSFFNQLDAETLGQVIVGLTTCPANKHCDVNYNGVVNSADGAALLRILSTQQEQIVPIDYGKLTGKVLVGPICPVVSSDIDCSDKPYVGSVEIIDSNATSYVSQTVTTDSNGLFSLQLNPGNYQIKITGYLRPSLTDVVIESRTTTDVVILVDTGIR